MANTTKKTTNAPAEVEAPVLPDIATSVDDKYVTIRIPRENKDQEDKVVWVNNRRFLIKRGVPVDVPESVALILEQEERMLVYCYEYENKVQKGN